MVVVGRAASRKRSCGSAEACWLVDRGRDWVFEVAPGVASGIKSVGEFCLGRYRR